MADLSVNTTPHWVKINEKAKELLPLLKGFTFYEIEMICEDLKQKAKHSSVSN